MEPTNSRLVEQHVVAIASRSATDTAQLASAVAALAWPAGTEDRHSPAAAAWLRHWRPVAWRGRPAVCACAVGRCAVCN